MGVEGPGLSQGSPEGQYFDPPEHLTSAPGEATSISQMDHATPQSLHPLVDLRKEEKRLQEVTGMN